MTQMDDDYMDIDDAEVVEVKPKATPVLKGRKRFAADLAEMKDKCKVGLPLSGLVIKGFRAGDDEGAVEFKVLRDGQQFLAVTLLASDTSGYPRESNFFSFAQETDLPPAVLDVIEGISSASPRPLQETVTRLASDLARALGMTVQASQETEDSGSEDEGMFDDELDYQFGGSGSTAPAEQITALKRDFLEASASSYRPGLTRFGADDFVVSVSLPVLSLPVPPRALAAWDRQLLSSSQNLCLLISGNRGVYPMLAADGSFARTHVKTQFSVGLCPSYKPAKDTVGEVTRNYGMKEREMETPLFEPEPLPEMDPDDPDTWNPAPVIEEEIEENQDPGRFDSFSLSSSMESLMNDSLVAFIKLRIRFGMGWAGAEVLMAEMIKAQQKPEDLLAGPFGKIVEKADREERNLRATYQLPHDPLYNHTPGVDLLNLPHIAFAYLVRRVMLCPRYCIVCHQKVVSDFEALKPYVCDSKLCAYQYYALNFGTSIEYEIRANPTIVDLLLSLTYVSAREGQLSENLPVGLGLRVPVPSIKVKGNQHQNQYATHYNLQNTAETEQTTNTQLGPGDDGLVHFDDLSLEHMRGCIVELLDSLPKVTEMRKFLIKKVEGGRGKSRLSVRKMKVQVLPAAWVIMRWCVASCTAYLEELAEEDELIRGIEPTYRQFRFSVGAPTKEALFQKAIAQAKTEDANAAKFPILYAFHGSPLRNWHSIIRQGLHFNTVTHGRAYGHGVYFAKDGSVSTGTYAATGSYRWKNSHIQPNSCVALAEIVNLPHKFVSSNPYYVVNEVSWIMTKYLLVAASSPSPSWLGNTMEKTQIPYQTLDPKHPITLGGKPILIPEHQHKLEALVAAQRREHKEEDYDAEDSYIFSAGDLGPELPSQPAPEPKLIPQPVVVRPANDWKHNPAWVEMASYSLLPPPSEASPMATLAVQRELRAIMKEQEQAPSLSELGYYIPPELMTDNLFQWMVELHSFEPTLPIAQDLKAKGVNSVLFEIRFPPTFPHSPPFFRIIKPRFLPFIHGGGGHVTGGGSICMDLLVSDGWLPSYSIGAILLQIRLAISNLDPRPARLSPQWDVAYGVQEALEGFKRAANTHGWKVPPGTEKLVR